MQSKYIESLHTITVAQNTMLGLLRGHYKVITKISEFRAYEFKARLNCAIGTGLPNRKPW